MKTMQAKVASKNLLTGCWIYENRRYIHADEKDLPSVDLCDECVLKDNGIPYRISKRYGHDVCEYWNPECYEEKEVTLPLYAKVFDGYQYTGKNHTGTILTDETLEKAGAWKFVDFVEDKVKENHRHLQEMERYQILKKALNGGLAAMKSVENSSLYRGFTDINMDGDHFVYLPLHDAVANFMCWGAIFDMNRIVPGGYVTLQVPKHLEGWVKGTKGTNIRGWAQAIGVKRINVVPY